MPVDVRQVEESVAQALEGLARVPDHLGDVCVADRFGDVELENLVIEHIAHGRDLDRLRAYLASPCMMPEVDTIDRVVPDSDAFEGPSPCHGTDPAETADLQHPDGLRAANL